MDTICKQELLSVKRLSDMERIDQGVDSVVYKFKNSDYVVKIYSGLREGLLGQSDFHRCCKIIDKYVYDTLMSKQILESEWPKISKGVNEILLNNKIYTLMPTVLPQGERREMFYEIVLIGQKYISGFNLQKICQGYGSDQEIYSSMNAQHEKLEKTMKLAFSLISDRMRTSFNLALKNVTPVVDDSTQTLDMVITDLAGGIGEIYAPIFDYPYFPPL